MSVFKMEQPSLHIGRENLLAFVRSMIGASTGRPDDDSPLPPGPWDPVIRTALDRANVFGPHPEPWRTIVSWQFFLRLLAKKHPEIWEVVGGGPLGEIDKVAINPQPLPPRYAFLTAVAQTVIARAQLLQEISEATSGEQRGIIVVGGFTSRFADDWCGNGFHLNFPFPGPRPNWFTHELDGIDLVVIASEFEQAAKQSFSPVLRDSFSNATNQFMEAGFSRMQF